MLKEKKRRKKEMEILVNEKSLNKSIFSINKPKKIPFKYPLKYFNRDNLFTCYNGVFNHEHWTVLDVICTCMIHCVYIGIRTNQKKFGDKHMFFKNGGNSLEYVNADFSRIVPNVNTTIIKNLSPNMTSNMLTILRDIKDTDIIPMDYYTGDSPKLYKPFIFCFDSLDLRSCSSILKKYSVKKINMLIEEISVFLIRTMYDVRYFDWESKKYKYESVHLDNFPSRLFRIEAYSDLQLKPERSHKLYSLTFDTILGYLFAQNVLSGNLNFIQQNVYELNRISHILYKIILLPSGINVSKKTQIFDYSYINSRLNLRLPSLNIIKSVVNKSLDELLNKGLISLYKETNNQFVIITPEKVKNND
jgi:hypothetical protein